MQVHPYLDFNGRCEEAVEFYRRALGAEVSDIHRFKNSPDARMKHPGIEEKVMHTSFRLGDATIMASDGHCTGKPTFQGFTLSINLTDAKEAERLFTALADGGQVHMPLTKTFFAASFGIVVDRFGVSWMLHVPA